MVDRSGSMSGKKIEQAKGALKFVLNNLRRGDLFNIVAYDSEIESFRPELEKYNDQTRKAAIGFVEGIEARLMTIDQVDRAFLAEARGKRARRLEASLPRRHLIQLVGLVLLGGRSLGGGYLVHVDFAWVNNLKEGAEVRASRSCAMISASSRP